VLESRGFLLFGFFEGKSGIDGSRCGREPCYNPRRLHNDIGPLEAERHRREVYPRPKQSWPYEKMRSPRSPRRNFHQVDLPFHIGSDVGPFPTLVLPGAR
jgi:hypothetical protein